MIPDDDCDDFFVLLHGAQLLTVLAADADFYLFKPVLDFQFKACRDTLHASTSENGKQSCFHGPLN